ncbi:Bax inhibitor-1/YccA family protein [Rhizosphaericola mali]|uniref:Bax inhibitor-1/YccA family protein n=1 Tax=Rhizosphaericola mali TaxID=2545455 RepID=A0A5P2G2G8_9BACT|nr:Bax inhibitor-1/YccA family protein [Rhizosphaericola mali]QES90004.1 Bax inhibitor-1/YccA family protein [Rhizosphaericola mali]
MALFKSGNPALSDKIFQKSIETQDSGTMTVKGTMSKFGLLLFLVIAGAIYSWNLYGAYRLDTMNTLMWVGAIGGFICAIVMSFKPQTAKYISPIYSLLEGLFLGGISVLVNAALAKKAPNVIFQAIGLTFAVAIVMFFLYSFKIIKPTEKLKSTIISATLGVALFYGIAMILNLFHVNLPFMYNSSALGIGLSLLVIVIAAMNLILDFDMIDQGSAMGAPKFMEWYCAFGLMVTIVWLYVEILKLMIRLFGNSRN